VRGFAQCLLEALGCAGSLNHEGGGLEGGSLRLRCPYASQAAAAPEGIRVTIQRLRRCRAAAAALVQARPRVSGALIEIALRDSGNYAAGAGGGANGCIRYPPERTPSIQASGLQAAFAEVERLYAQCGGGGVSWADVVYMAAAAALEQRGVSGLQMLYGRRDGEETEAVPPVGLLPEFSGATHEAVKAPSPAPEGEPRGEAAGGGGGEAAGGGGGEEVLAKPPPEKPKVQLIARLSRLELTPLEQVALVGLYLSLQQDAEAAVSSSAMSSAGGDASIPPGPHPTGTTSLRPL